MWWWLFSDANWKTDYSKYSIHFIITQSRWHPKSTTAKSVSKHKCSLSLMYKWLHFYADFLHTMVSTEIALDHESGFESKDKKLLSSSSCLYCWHNRDLQSTLPNKIWSVTVGPTGCVKELLYRCTHRLCFCQSSLLVHYYSDFRLTFLLLKAPDWVYIFTLKLTATCCYTWYSTQSSPVINWARFSYNPEVDDGNRNCLTAWFWTGDTTSLWSSHSNFLKFCSFISYLM